MSAGGPSKAGSTSSTPAPPSQAETLSHAGAPKPFRNPAFNKPLNRRNKTLKQIVIAERDAALGITGRIKKRKTGEEALVIVRGKTKLAGAAAKAALKREARAKKEAAAAAAAAAGEDAESSKADDNAVDQEGEVGASSPAPSNTADAGPGGGGEADVTMENASVVGDVDTSRAESPTEQKKKDIPMYWSVEAPPSLRARKKYCDVTGLIAPYTDPRTRLRYHSAEVFEIIRNFGPGLDQAYLSLRGDSTTIK